MIRVSMITVKGEIASAQSFVTIEKYLCDVLGKGRYDGLRGALAGLIGASELNPVTVGNPFSDGIRAKGERRYWLD